MCSLKTITINKHLHTVILLQCASNTHASVKVTLDAGNPHKMQEIPLDAGNPYQRLEIPLGFTMQQAIF